MTSQVVCSPHRVCCVVCRRTVSAGKARMIDVCGPVYICSRCPNVYAMWPNCQEMPASGILAVSREGPTQLTAERRATS
jgi:hypothetical protein